ncbi:ATP phosphoribosyltransferase [Candidatus Termititenax persephonae]|uniref:ATP phosphoribosyltransferase n=1 Tax=Candidatus Termititenax persephonae TaxID=2218525 RepID=A0A388TGQ2_9BACT|nr:ATP phosphoribosyltransferase [Candidatus Termititenax persephonae]
MLTIALSKGYLLDTALKLFKKIGLHFPAADISRKLEFMDSTGEYRFLIVRPVDVPVYVEYGTADLGIAGKDILLEGRHKVTELLDLKFGFCRLVLAARRGAYRQDTLPTGLRVATKFSNSAAAYFQKLDLDVELIKLYGSVELAPVDGLSDVIIDLVATGRTLKENGLEVLDEIYQSTARLIANRVKAKSRYREIMALAKKIKRVA